MPTDIVLVFTRKAEEAAQASKDALTHLTIVCYWSALGLVLTVLAIRMGFDADLVQAFVIAG